MPSIPTILSLQLLDWPHPGQHSRADTAFLSCYIPPATASIQPTAPTLIQGRPTPIQGRPTPTQGRATPARGRATQPARLPARGRPAQPSPPTAAMCAENPTPEPPLERLISFFADKGVLIVEDDLQMGRVLGHGASGITHSATYRGDKVAVKVYSPAVLAHEFVSVRNEMEIMTMMRHENIIDFCGLLLKATPPTAALVTTLAPKGELGNALYKRSSLRRRGDEARFRIAQGMARGLQYLHANNVIHRDIKPANVLLGANYEAKLTDFGYSRFIDHSGIMTGETGSYRYMAPEITRHGRYGPKADVFSFAVVVNELFCEERPYEFQLPFDVALGVVKNNLRPSQRRIRNPRLKNIISRAWDSDPLLRPDWEEIIDELRVAQEEMAAERRAGVTGKLLSRLGVGGNNANSAFKKS